MIRTQGLRLKSFERGSSRNSTENWVPVQQWWVHDGLVPSSSELLVFSLLAGSSQSWSQWVAMRCNLWFPEMRSPKNPTPLRILELNCSCTEPKLFCWWSWRRDSVKIYQGSWLIIIALFPTPVPTCSNIHLYKISILTHAPKHMCTYLNTLVQIHVCPHASVAHIHLSLLGYSPLSTMINKYKP